MIEIGTAYGLQLKYYAGFCKRVISVDCMYNWVPDIDQDSKFDESLVDSDKVSSWKSEVNDNGLDEICELVVGSSYEVCEDNETITNSDFDVLIVDGCHHPAQAVAADYRNFRKFMKSEHIVVFDDMQISDCKAGAETIVQELKTSGEYVSSQTGKIGSLTVLVVYVRRRVSGDDTV